ncbi:hypothetical protein MMC12_004099 [Toensbergia leucococca]|nr:hypothetical protein [Toensbergia leucococca]
MPPFIPRKRRRSISPLHESPAPKSVKRPSLFDTLENPRTLATIQDNKKFLDELDGSGTETSLSDISSCEFEDAVPSGKPRSIYPEEDEDEDEADWEDAIQPNTSNTPVAKISGDLEISLNQGARIGSLTTSLNRKKGPSKVERQIRTFTHCMHVQFLLFHNLIRNAWVSDEKVRTLLVNQLPAGVKKEIEKWRTASGIDVEPRDGIHASPKGATRKRRGNSGNDDARSQRDWGKPAIRQESGVPDLSRGDPLLRLLKILAAYWKKRFAITAPSLRKQGYKSPASLKADVASFQNDKYDPSQHGERIADLLAFTEYAKTCEGSRDVGAQLFTALVRGLGIQARLVVSLQPLGFGWSKGEDAVVRRKKVPNDLEANPTGNAEGDGGGTSTVEEDSSGDVEVTKPAASRVSNIRASRMFEISSEHKKKGRGQKDEPVDHFHESGDAHNDLLEDDEDSIVDVTPLTPRRMPDMNYDEDMPFPTYWTEVISPITSEVIPVDSLVLTPAVTTKPELFARFEPRGAKADKAKQILAYVVAYSNDNTAKDVTTRYLRRHMWPGKTKGVRLPVEKIPAHNKRGKIKHYEDYDWFKNALSGYRRPQKMRTLADDLEEAKDLKALRPEKREAKGGEETLQGYKSSANFVLERHLRREEAIPPSAKPVKTFVTGKGDNAKEEPVFKREDVMICRTGESWHKEGRQVKAGEHPMKMVPVRAVTLTRKREVEEAERDGGEKLKQGLYALDQTEWIIPPPIENGIIPKNAFGNMDCYVPTMVPRGAVHIPLQRSMRICKRLGIDYAEAVTGFEFGKQRAVPVITGVVVATEHEDLIIDEWEKDEEERRRREDGKKEKASLATWRKFLMGLRIVERVREEYGGDANAHMREELNPFTNKNKKLSIPAPSKKFMSPPRQDLNQHEDKDVAGGFLADEASDDEGGERLVLHEDGENSSTPRWRGGFLIEEESGTIRTSLASTKTAPAGQASGEIAFERLGRELVENEKKAMDSDINDEGHSLKQRLSRLEERRLVAKTSVLKSKTTKKSRAASRNKVSNKEASSSNNGLNTPNTRELSKSRVNGASQKLALTKAPSKAPSKGKANGTEDAALKSHYFSRNSDEEMGGAQESISSADESLSKPQATFKRAGAIRTANEAVARTGTRRSSKKTK